MELNSVVPMLRCLRLKDLHQNQVLPMLRLLRKSIQVKHRHLDQDVQQLEMRHLLLMQQLNIHQHPRHEPHLH